MASGQDNRVLEQKNTTNEMQKISQECAQALINVPTNMTTYDSQKALVDPQINRAVAAWMKSARDMTDLFKKALQTDLPNATNITSVMNLSNDIDFLIVASLMEYSALLEPLTEKLNNSLEETLNTRIKPVTDNELVDIQYIIDGLTELLKSTKNLGVSGYQETKTKLATLLKIMRGGYTLSSMVHPMRDPTLGEMIFQLGKHIASQQTPSPQWPTVTGASTSESANHRASSRNLSRQTRDRGKKKNRVGNTRKSMRRKIIKKPKNKNNKKRAKNNADYHNR